MGFEVAPLSSNNCVFVSTIHSGNCNIYLKSNDTILLSTTSNISHIYYQNGIKSAPIDIVKSPGGAREKSQLVKYCNDDSDIFSLMPR